MILLSVVILVFMMGESHGIGRFIWGSTNYEITFKDKDGNYTLNSSEWPEYTNVGDYLVEYRLTNENYEPYYGSNRFTFPQRRLRLRQRIKP